MPSLRLVKGETATVSDARLCRDFLDGDEAAFGELLRRHQEVVFRLLRRYGQSPDDVRDLTQRAFLQAFEAARRTLPRIAAHPEAGGDVPFRAWLLRIAINLGKNHLRDSSRWKRSPLEVLDSRASPAPSAQSSLEENEVKLRVKAAVLELPKRQREVFGLRIDAGLSFADVSKTLGITEGNAKTHFHYAVKRLKELINAGAAHDVH